MLKKKQLRSAVKPIIGALALALSSQMAYAVDVNQLPANGHVVAGSASPTTVSTVITSVAAGLDITVSGNTVIDWAGTSKASIAGTITTLAMASSATQAGGFNIGQKAGVAFTGSGAVLNVDVSGNPSVIAGQISSAVPLYVANANGITVANGTQIDATTLGFINADLSSTQATALFSSSGVIPLNFTGSAGVQIQAGTDLSGVSKLIVAGAGNVNIDGVSGVNSYIPNSEMIVDGGVGGYISSATTTPQFIAAESGAATPVSNLTTSNYSESTTFYQDAPASVALNLGTTSSPFNFSASSAIMANGNIALSGVMADANNVFTFGWNGILTNNGVFDANSQTGSALGTGANQPVLLGYPDYDNNIYNNQASTSTVPLGGLVNNGTLAGFSSFDGSSFNNQGNIVLTDTGAQRVTINAYTAASGTGYVSTATGTVTLGGSITALQSGATIGPVSLSGGTVNINTTMANVNGAINVTAGTLNITSTVSAISGNDFTFDANTNGAFNLASTGSISADNVFLAPGLAGHVVLTNFIVNGGISATGNDGNVLIGGYTSSSGLLSLSAPYGNQVGNMVNNVSGSGSITADNVTFNSLLGAVNNITTSNMFQNGFTINNATSGGVTNITFNAVNGNTVNQQGVNLKINGNATINSGVTQVEANGTGSVAGGFPTPKGNSGQFTPDNANSRLVVQASGNLSTSGGGLSFPGLIYLSAANSMTVNSLIDNAYSLNSPAGYGIWLVSPNITDYSGFLTVGNRAVNFVSPNANANSAVLGGWGSAAQSVNGLDLSKATSAQVSSLAQTLITQQIERAAVNPNFNPSTYNLNLPSTYPIVLDQGYVSFNGNTLAQ